MSDYYIPPDLSGYGSLLADIPNYGPPPLRHANPAQDPNLRGAHPAAPVAHPHPADVAMGLRAALLRILHEKTFGQGMDELHPQRHAQPAGGGESGIPEKPGGPGVSEGGDRGISKPPNINAAALKAAGSLFRELAKHHEHEADPAQGGGKRELGPPARPAIPVDDFMLRHTQPAHHPAMRPHPLQPTDAMQYLRDALSRAL